MKLRFTARAHRDLVSITSHIEERNPSAATRVVREIDRTLGMISAMPRIGRRSARPGTREFPVRRLPYLVVYRVAGDTVEILTIFHTSRDPRTK